MDKEKALLLFNQSNWDDTDPDSAWSAVNACEAAGFTPTGAWIEVLKEGPAYWFTRSPVLIHVTGHAPTWMVDVTRPKFAAARVELQGDPADAAFAMKLSLIPPKDGRTYELGGAGRRAQYLHAFYKRFLLNLVDLV